MNDRVLVVTGHLSDSLGYFFSWYGIHQKPTVPCAASYERVAAEPAVCFKQSPLHNTVKNRDI
jgi:hypothetical protein